MTSHDRRTAAERAPKPSNTSTTEPLRVGKVGEQLLEGAYPLLLYPSLASTFGVAEAIFISQLHYWLGKSRNTRDGRKWSYNSIRAWHKEFPFWHENTIRSAIARLETRGIVVSRNYNRFGFDRTKWYTLDYEALQAALPATVERSPSPVPSMTQELASAPPQDGEPIPETSNRDYSETEEDAARRAALWSEFCLRSEVKNGVNHDAYWEKVKKMPDTTPALEHLLSTLTRYNPDLYLMPGSVFHLNVAAEILHDMDFKDASFTTSLSDIEIANPACLQLLAPRAADWAWGVKRGAGRTFA